MEIHIHIPRPWQTLFVLALVFFWATGPYGFGGSAHEHAEASGGVHQGTLIAEAQQVSNRERVKQAVLERREEILRYQVQVLEEEALRTNDPTTLAELADHRRVLLAIIAERSASERLLASSITELWDAQGTQVSRAATAGIRLEWPIDPVHGISAHFDDAGYEKRFGMAHNAIDIPTPQGTVIRAPADGVVAKVSLNGLGYSYVVLEHDGGVETVYGHVSEVLVAAGDRVRAGSPIARSGGRPGSPGAGLLTTGPHLHFAVKQEGALVDPMKYLMER